MQSSIFAVIQTLHEKQISFTIIEADLRSITILATLVGKRIEIYVSSEGEIDFSVFTGNEDITIGLDALRSLLDS